MRKLLLPLLALILLCSHDLYVTMDSYFLSSGQEAVLSLYNGTFEKSENIITRDRMLDASIVGHGTRTAIDSSLWKDQDSTITYLNFTAGRNGTYVAGVSTKARNIELTAEKFNSYLEHDGVLDMLEQRKSNNTLDQPAVESYQKHVKAIYQVGEELTDDWNTILGYPIEFVPQENPYAKHTGDDLKVQLLLDGDPLANQLVYALHQSNSHSHENASHSHEHEHDGETHSHAHESSDEAHGHSHNETSHSHEHEHDGVKHSHEHESGDEGHGHSHYEVSQNTELTDSKTNSSQTHTHTNGQQLRTDDNGMITVALPEDGIYYLRTIHMVNSEKEGLTHESKWATLSFELTHRHGVDTHTHDGDHHDHDGEIPTWLFVLGSILVVGILFLVFSKKNNNA